MCGIAAIVELFRTADAARRDQRRQTLLDMLGTFAHRGDPEHFGELLVEEDFALGTNRLAIVDRDHARQPVADPDGQVVVAFNGEIYNHERLRAELEACGHRFRTRSDTEVLVNGYLEWGEELPERLDGIFAFVLVDRAKGSVLAARDHIGIKPLYYLRRGDGLYLASEQKGLLALGAEIETLAPGCYLRDGVVRRYFDLPDEPPAPPLRGGEAAQVAECRRLLEEAVRKQVQTDLPLAVMFSAGIDSSIVLHLARKYHGDVTAVTIGLEGATDVPLAERYCAEHGIPQLTYRLRREELVALLPRIAHAAEFFEGIDAIDACVAYFGYRLARSQGFKVALCGEGSDEVLAGYDLFRGHPEPEALMHYRVHNLHRTDLQRVDRASMLNSVEARVPFLDKDFLRFAYHLPMAMKLRDGVEKWVLREAFRDVLPDYLVDRPKVRMPEGSGVKSLLMDHAAAQGKRVGAELRRGLGLDTPQAEYFCALYLDAGFPPPRERHRLAGRDYSENGYFAFAS